MRFDVHADVGDWAFRRLPMSGVDGVLAVMRRHGIAAAVVGPVEGILYRNPEGANALLFERLAQAESSACLLPAAVINPVFPGWQRDLETAGRRGARAVKLYPNYHGYDAGGGPAQELARAAAALGLPLICCVRVEDERQHHWHLLMPPVQAERVAALAKAVPEAKIVLACGNQREIEVFLAATPADRCWAELSYLKSPSNSVEQMVSKVGAPRLLFGTHLPFLDPGVTTVKVERSGVPEEALTAILSGNALALWPELTDAAACAPPG